MINANELRDMNYVYTNNKEIVPIRCGGILAIQQGRFKCFPIPLTPEILEKCGFEKIQTSNKYGWYIDCGKNIDLCWCFSDYVSIELKIGKCDDFNDVIKDINCQHLHQLQNLYFALTGEELQYTP